MPTSLGGFFGLNSFSSKNRDSFIIRVETHIPYSVTATDAADTTTRNGGKFLPATPEIRSHDDDGNLTSDGRFSYTWDAENRLMVKIRGQTYSKRDAFKLPLNYDRRKKIAREDGTHWDYNYHQNKKTIYEGGLLK